LTIDVSPVPDGIDEYPAGGLIDCIDDPIVADTDTIQFLRRTQFARSARKEEEGCLTEPRRA